MNGEPMIFSNSPHHIIEPDASYDINGYGGRTVSFNRSFILESMWAEYRRTFAEPITVWPLEAPQIEDAEMDGIESKICEHCGEVFYRDYPTSEKAWNKRRFCGQECFQTNRNQRVNTENIHNCVVCGALITRRDGEDAFTFRTRKACSTECRNLLKSKTRKAAHEAARLAKSGQI